MKSTHRENLIGPKSRRLGVAFVRDIPLKKLPKRLRSSMTIIRLYQKDLKFYVLSKKTVALLIDSR